MAQLEEMRAEIDSRLANPLLYARGDGEAIETLQRKRAEVMDGLARAEALWMAALERLEAAGAGLMSIDALITTFVTLFVVIDPIAVAPLFVALTRGMTARGARRDRRCGRSWWPSRS